MFGKTLLLAALVLLLSLGMPSTVQARIGEARAECEQRYGKGKDL
jgi:hypothetical protein